MPRRNRAQLTGSQGLALLQQHDRVEALLWRRALEEDDHEARAKLFELYLPLAHKVASTEFARRKDFGHELADIRQLASEGLLQAINRYDAARQVPFAAFARRRINGNIADGLAKADEKSAQYRFRQRAERDRMQSLARDRDAESDALTEIGRLASLLAIGIMLEDAVTVDPDMLPSSEINAYESLAWTELQQQLFMLVDRLDKQAQFVLVQHYRHDVRFSEIADILGLSKGRISQIHRSALQQLRAELERYR